ncbi:MAG: hypothetical protein ACM3VS_08115 [Candidatus Dadabacteria bacterium]
MKEKIYNPASTNNTSPSPGMAAVNTFNSEEMDTAEENTDERRSEPKHIENEETRTSEESERKPS